MKATLEFNLDDPDDRMAHMRCVKSLDMAIVLSDISYNLRRRTENSNLQTADEAIGEIFDAINGLYEDYNINISDLIQ
jgi:hypothetical protein